MRLWTLQAVVVGFLLLVGWGASSLPAIFAAKPNAMCAAPKDDMARRACADLAAGK